MRRAERAGISFLADAMWSSTLCEFQISPEKSSTREAESFQVKIAKMAFECELCAPGLPRETVHSWCGGDIVVARSIQAGGWTGLRAMKSK